MCKYTPTWISRGGSLHKAYMEEWEKVDVVEVRAPGGDSLTSPSSTSKNEVAWKHHGTQEDDSTWKSQGTQNILHRDNASLPKSSWEAVGSFDAPSWKYTGTQRSDTSWGSWRAQPSLNTRSFHFIHPKQYGAFPRRIVLPHPYSEVLSGLGKD